MKLPEAVAYARWKSDRIFSKTKECDRHAVPPSDLVSSKAEPTRSGADQKDEDGGDEHGREGPVHTIGGANDEDDSDVQADHRLVRFMEFLLVGRLWG